MYNKWYMYITRTRFIRCNTDDEGKHNLSSVHIQVYIHVYIQVRNVF